MLSAYSGSALVLKRENGKLALHVRRCKPASASSDRVFAYAYMSAQLDAAEVPIFVSNIPEEGWWTTVEMFVPDSSRSAFDQLQYPVTAVDIAYESMSAETGAHVRARLSFPNGVITVSAKAIGNRTDVRESSALVYDGDSALSVFFGEQTGLRRKLSAIELVATGQTPLSAVDLSAAKAAGHIEEQAKADRIHWRLPHEAAN